MNGLENALRELQSQRAIPPLGPPIEASTKSGISVIIRRAGALQSGDMLFALSQPGEPNSVYVLTYDELKSLLTAAAVERIRPEDETLSGTLPE
jgi:hypothetical protein